MSSQGFANTPRRARWRHRRQRAWSPLTLKTETTRSLPVLVPVAVLGTAGIVAAVASLVADPPSGSTLAGIVGLLVAAIAAEALPLPIEGVSAGWTSLAIVPIVAAAVLYGWAEAGIVGFSAMAIVEVARRRPPERIVFNTALYTCAAIVAGLAASPFGHDDLWAIVAGATLGAGAFYVVDMLFLSAVVARSRGMGFVELLGRYVLSTALPFLVMTSLSIALIVLWERSPWIAFAIVGPLVIVALHERWLHGAFERQREVDRLKDEFIAVISHELRTPLTSVYGAALTLQKRDLDEGTRHALLGIVSDEAGRLARLLDRALSASRLDADRETFDIGTHDGVAIARSVVDATRQRLPHGTDLELVAHGHVAPVLADPDKLRQVLVNLIENAIKYSPDGGHIEVSIENGGSRVRFHVRDEGIGIPADKQAHVFERFHRLDANSDGGVGGLGLGLYISHELVERMGGRIDVASRVGEGSTFTFDLPAANA